MLAVVLALAAYGCAELIVRLIGHFFAPIQPRGVYVLSLSGGEAEYTVRSLMAQRRCPVIVIDRGLDPETRRILLTLEKEYPCLHICTPENFEKIWISCLQ